jgi:hypothetical protein
VPLNQLSTLDFGFWIGGRQLSVVRRPWSVTSHVPGYPRRATCDAAVVKANCAPPSWSPCARRQEADR